MKAKENYVATLGIKTDEGTFLAKYSTTGLARLEFPTTNKPAEESTDQARHWHKLTTDAVRNILRGEPERKLPPLDLSCGTPFQRKVWTALQRIPAGKTETYAKLAASLKKAKAARAVGGACGANPIPLLIPCHRVVASGGGLGGFSGGLHWKEKLLGREQARH